MKTKSIKLRLFLIFLTIFTVLITGILVSNQANNQIRSQYNRYLKDNTDLSTLPVKINELATRFDVMTRRRDDESINQIRELNTEISAILASIRLKTEHDRNSLMYFRMLSNMLEYQQTKVNELILKQNYDRESYAEVLYIKNLYSYMNQTSQSLMMSYQEYSSKEQANRMEEIRGRQANVNLVLIFCGLFSIVFVFLLSRDIFITLRDISKNAKLLANGEWFISDIKTNHYKELDSVARAFNKMKKSILMYINQLNNKAEVERQLNEQKLLITEKEKLLKESQLLNLQMQMNPHFLFNTLNMIGRTAMLEDNQATVKLIESISVMLRFNLENEGKMVPLSQELKALQAYIFIQGMRFQERISIELNGDTNLEHFFIPPLSLQPIVENCLIHGLNDCRTDGLITIDVNAKDDYVQITINDNGKGIEKGRLEKLFSPNHRTSIGLANVKRRLELSFGQNNLLRINSTLNKGTTVQISLPIEERE